jgi:Alpha-tubulin suppressor and related RCC1 domain-containing proteins
VVPAENISYTCDSGQYTVTLTPAADQSGTSTITVTAIAPDGFTATESFNITVNEINAPPYALNQHICKTIDGGMGHTIALRADGTVLAWGSNYYGQLGDGTTTNRLTPVVVSELEDIVAIAAGEKHNLALKYDGSLWAVGRQFLWPIGRLHHNETTHPHLY